MTTTDKRTITTDALETLGMIIDEGAGRDAIHLAVEPVVAAHVLRPGDHIGLDEHGHASVVASPLGIVDPFLKNAVEPGQRFWLVVYPRQITSLRHVWEHPAFPAEDRQPNVEPHSECSASEAWIREWAANIPLSYETVMDGAREYVSSRRTGGYGEYLCFGGLLEDEYVPDEFWSHYEKVTGEKVDDDHRGSFFTCSC